MTDPSATFDATFATRVGPKTTRFHEIRTFPLLDSTNRYLKDQAAAGAEEGLVAIAQHQSAGRGRQGRVWDSKPGASLLLSVLLRPRDVASAQRITSAMGLAIIDACKIVGGFTAHLKWPNDVIVKVDDEGTYKKLSGVLAELVMSDGEVTAVVVGAGINLNWNGELPEALQATAISADELAGHAIDNEAFADSVLIALNERLGRPSWLMQAYRERCATLGQHVNVTIGDDEIVGVARDVDDDGALIITRDDGEEEKLIAGEVTHLRLDDM